MKLSQFLKLTAGFTALALGLVGAVLPVWPTTPFVLLALGCFSATPALQSKILKIGFFREYYESYTRKTGLRRRTVAGSLIFLWGMLTVSAVLIRKLPVCLLLAAVGAAVTVHILWIAKKRG